MIFKRKIYNQMLEWKHSKKGSTALLIKGARRIGKSTIAEEFARNEYESYIAIDFGDASREVWDAVNHITDRDYFFTQLQLIYGKKLVPGKSVIIFDEIQMCPEARQAIKHLVKDGRYDYIETGSLLSIKKNTQNIVIPSEETRITMYPMDYEEFCWATGSSYNSELLENLLHNRTHLGDNIVRKLLRDFRLYIAVGGMPQAVKSYIESKNLYEVDKIKREILELYFDDFQKIDPSGTIERLFKTIPSQLTGNASRFKLGGEIKIGERSRITPLIRELEDSLTVNIAYHANDPNVGLSLHADYDFYKMYLCDTGLFVTLAFWDNDFPDNTIYQKLINDKLSADLGYIYENVVAQILTASGHKLFYYTWRPEGGKHNYEIDFILTSGSKIIPVEVKSSGYKLHKSLDLFMEKFSSRVKEAYIIYTKDLRRIENISYIPVFLTPLL